MAYQALYRTYRPKRFEQIIGQPHITTILKNQVQSGNASHAYLFCGSRGTGKTSTAKVFARSINCLSPVEGEACGVCKACTSMEHEPVDIIEIDAASNNGVDDIRALIEQARFTPLSLKKKVYIIDEVHMLSSAASNALLKTLEEPPAHVVFLLATTEPQKLLATIISRCQRFDFRRLFVSDIVHTLEEVLLQVGATIAQEGLLTIARVADGGMRDALSLADQCLAFCGTHVSAADVYDVLGNMDTDFLFRIADALLLGQAAQALRLLDEIIQNGRDLLVFSQDLMQHMRALLLTKACGDCKDLLDCTQETMALYQAQAAIASEERLLRAIEQLTATQNAMKQLGQPRILLESMLVRICRPEDANSLLALEDRMARLEQMVSAQGATKTAAPAEAQTDSPPWEEAPSASETGTQRRAPKKAEPPKAVDTSAIHAQEANKKTASETKSVQTDVWQALQNAMQKQNISLYISLTKAQSASCEGDTLTLTFSKAAETFASMLNMPKNLPQLQAILKDIAPELKLFIRVQEPHANDAHTKELQEIFGDKLVIKE